MRTDTFSSLATCRLLIPRTASIATSSSRAVSCCPQALRHTAKRSGAGTSCAAVASSRSTLARTALAHAPAPRGLEQTLGALEMNACRQVVGAQGELDAEHEFDPCTSEGRPQGARAFPHVVPLRGPSARRCADEPGLQVPRHRDLRRGECDRRAGTPWSRDGHLIEPWHVERPLRGFAIGPELDGRAGQVEGPIEKRLDPAIDQHVDPGAAGDHGREGARDRSHVPPHREVEPPREHHPQPGERQGDRKLDGGPQHPFSRRPEVPAPRQEQGLGNRPVRAREWAPFEAGHERVGLHHEQRRVVLELPQPAVDVAPAREPQRPQQRAAHGPHSVGLIDIALTGQEPAQRHDRFAELRLGADHRHSLTHRVEPGAHLAALATLGAQERSQPGRSRPVEPCGAIVGRPRTEQPRIDLRNRAPQMRQRDEQSGERPTPVRRGRVREQTAQGIRGVRDQPRAGARETREQHGLVALLTRDMRGGLTR